MAGTGAFEEALRLVLETSGTEGVDALRQALVEMGVATEEAGADTAKLIDRLADLNATAGKAEAFSGMMDTLDELQQSYDANQRAAYQLSLQIAETVNPSRDLLNAQKALRSEGDKLQTSLNKQWEAVTKADTALSELGVDTAQLASSQQRLRSEATRTAQAFTEQAKASAQAATETRKRNDQIEQSDASFRAQAKASTAAAESLKAYRERANQAAKDTTDLGTAASATSSIMDKLKGVAATALGFIGFGKLVDGIKSIITEGSDAEQELGQLEAALAATGRQSEFTADQLAQMRRQLQGGLFDDGEISKAQVRLLSYTNVVGAQFPAAMQIAIDQAQRLGMNLEQSAEVVGKALQTPSKAMESLSKQGFTLDASQKQLITQLEATGQVAQAQAIILDLLAESYGGAAAAAKVGTIAGLWKAATERFKDWKQEVADQGVLSYFKTQLSEMLALADRLAKDGTLTRWAKQTSDAIVTMASAARSATGWLIDHSGALVAMGKAYATFAIVRAIVQMNTWRIALMASTRAQIANVAAMDAAGKGALGLGNILKSLPRAVPITIALLGLELASKGLQSIGEAVGTEMGKWSQANKEAGQTITRVREQMYQQGVEYKKLAVSVSAFSQVQVKSSADVAAMGEEERRSYQARLDALKKYLNAQFGFLFTQKELGIATDEQLAQLEQVKARLTEVGAGYQALSTGSKVAGEALKSGIAAGAQLVVEQLKGIGSDSKLAVTEIGKLFQSLNFADTNSLGNVAVALASIAEQGAGAARNVRDGLLATLQQLSGEELMRFQASAQAAFASLPAAAANTTVVLEQTLLAAMNKLGVSADRLGVSFTAAGRDANAAFATVLENALATSSQIETAFKAALSNVATLDEAKALGAQLQAAGQQGKLGFDQAERSAAALNARIREITNAMNPLNDEFGRLGIQSQASLNAARDSAKEAFEAIRRGAAQGKASIEDVRRAFTAYSNTARAAVANSDKWKQDQVSAQLEIQGALYSTNAEFDRQGAKGAAAAQAVVQGSNEAVASLQQVQQAAAGAADSVAAVGDAAGGAGGNLKTASAAASGFSMDMGQISAKTRELLNQMSGPQGMQQFANIWNGLAKQRRDLQAYKEELQGVSNGMDELSKKRRELASRFDLVGEGELEELVQLETQIEAKRAERRRAARQDTQDRLDAAKQEAELQAAADAKRVGNGEGNG
ncbi:MAG: Laminin subunit alpha-2, partial [Stenotrophomonas sp.]